MKNEEDHFFSEFPPVSTEDWEQAIKKDLEGVNYKKKLTWETGEGFEILPFYRKEDMEDGRGKVPVHPTGDNKWIICSPVYAQNVEEANQEARQAHKQGAGALQFSINIRSTSGNLGGDLEGTAIQNQDSFNNLLKDIDVQETALFFDSGMASPLLLAMFQNRLKNRKPKQDISAFFSYDPFVYVAKKGQLPKRETLLKNEIIDLVGCVELPDTVKPLCADGRLWHNSGGTIIHELGLALATASEYLALLTGHGTEAKKAAESICFFMAVGSKYFPEIAKFRAFRLLWKQLIDAYGIDEDLPVFIHAETSRWNKTIYDPYVNMLRTSTEAMAATIAGVDSLMVHAFDVIFEKPNEFSERIARNSQIILQEEAHFDKVADPAAGSYYIEKITDNIAQKAWNLFQDVEQEGGLLKALRNGTVQTSIGEARKERNQEIALRRRVFVGTSQYPGPDEETPQDRSSTYSTVSLEETDYDFKLKTDTEFVMNPIREALAGGAALGDIVPKLFQEDFSKHNYRTVTPYRGSKAFEKLRQATERHKYTPKVLTIPVGDKKKRKTRSTFTANFFGCVGYDIKEPVGFDTVDGTMESINEQEPDIVVLCSSDEEYEYWVPKLCKRIGQMDDKPITVLAGYPEEQIGNYKKAGIDAFIHAKCDVLDSLKNFQQKLGVIEQ